MQITWSYTFNTLLYKIINSLLLIIYLNKKINNLLALISDQYTFILRICLKISGW